MVEYPPRQVQGRIMLGKPIYNKLGADLGSAILGINAVKGIEFGAGFHHATMKGSESNDIPYFDNENNKIKKF